MAFKQIQYERNFIVTPRNKKKKKQFPFFVRADAVQIYEDEKECIDKIRVRCYYWQIER